MLFVSSFILSDTFTELYKFSSKINELEFPNLKDYIEICKKYNKEAILEIKNEIEELDVINIIKEIESINWLNHTTIISFSMNNLLNIRKHFKNIKLQFLTGEFNDELLNILVSNNLNLDFYYKNITKEIIDKVHANNLIINCWTVDDVSDAQKLINMGVDMITSNILE